MIVSLFSGKFGFEGVEEVETVFLQLAFFPLPSFAFATITAFPFSTVFITPLEETVATFSLLEFQVTDLLFALPGNTVAFKVSDFPLSSVADVLLSLMLVTGCLTVTLQITKMDSPRQGPAGAAATFIHYKEP